MKIQCENCQIQHELDPPAWVVSSGRPFRFRCSTCGHSQSVSVTQPTTPSAAPAAADTKMPPVPLHREDLPAARVQPAGSSDAESSDPSPGEAAPAQSASPSQERKTPKGEVFLKQNGQLYKVKDWDTLVRWIEERRVDQHDMVSEGGVRWNPVLKSFYERKLQQGLPKKSALVAAMRKLLHLVYGVLLHQEPFNPHYEKA